MEIEARKQHKKLILISVQTIKISKVDARVYFFFFCLSLVGFHCTWQLLRAQKYLETKQKHLSYIWDKQS